MVNAVVKSRSPLWIAGRESAMGICPMTLGQEENYNDKDLKSIYTNFVNYSIHNMYL